jgi:hypothetical protein
MMALIPRVVDGLLQFASASRARSVVTLAAITFALCHLAVLATAPPLAAASAAGDADAAIVRLLLHFAAVLCRFALPVSVLIIGMAYGRSKRTVIRIKAGI